MEALTTKHNYTSNFLEAARQIQKGRFYTYVGFDTRYGMPYVDNIKVSYIRYIPYEGYKDCYLLVGPGIGKYQKSIRLYEGKQFLLYEGAVKPNVNTTIHYCLEDFESGHVKVAKRWPSFDPRYLYKAQSSLQVPPLLFHIKNITEPEIFITSHVIS